MILNTANIGYLISLGVSAYLAVFILQKSKRVSTKVFALLIGSIAFWIFCNFSADNIRNEDVSLIFAKLAVVGPIFIGPLFYNFARIFPNDEQKFRFNVFLRSLFTAVPLIIFVPTKFNVQDIKLVGDFGIEFTPGDLYTLLGIYLSIYILLSIFTLIQKYRVSNGVARSQLKFLGVGFISTFLVAIVSTLLLPLLGISNFSFIGPLSTLILSGSVSYTLLRHRLFGIRAFFGRILYLLVISLIPFIIFHFSYAIFSNATGGVYSSTSIFLGLIISVIFASTFLVINNKLSVFVNRSFIDPGLKYDSMREKLAKLYNSNLDINKIFDSTIDEYYDILKSKGLGIYLLKKNDDIYALLSRKEINLNIDNLSLLSILEKVLSKIDQRTLLIEELMNYSFLKKLPYWKDFFKWIDSNKVSILFHIAVNDTNQIIIVLREKEGGFSYNKEEITIMERIFENLSAAIDRSLLYEEVQQFNKTLQKKVEDATAELRVKNDLLSQALKKEKDLMDVMGHELRTPLGTARNALIYMHDTAKTGKLENDKLLRYIGIALENVRREKDMLEGILQSARLENGRVQVTRSKFTADDVVEDAMTSFKDSAIKKGIDLILDKMSSNVEMNTDRTAVQQIVDNFVSNAVKYTHKGSVTLRMEDLGERVKFSVIDTGEGIPEKDLPYIGKKFYRVNTHLDSEGKIEGTSIVRPGGTGIGLYVVKGLLEALGSKLQIKSKVGEGSTFFCEIPKFLAEERVRT